jgi:xylulokinase
MTLVAGIDSSTQSCKIVVRDLETGAVVRTGRASHPEGTEVHPDRWWDALLASVADAGGLEGVAAISVAAQQHGCVVLDTEGRVIRPALLWNDTRSATSATNLINEVGAAAYAERTGSVPVASFTATKLRWLRDHEPENAARVAAVALPHDWLTWRLRGYGPAGESVNGPDLEALTTDRSDASGTSYWNPTLGQYDLGLLNLALGRDGASATSGAAFAAGLDGADPGAGFGNSGLRAAVVLPRVLGPGEAAGTVAPIPEFATTGEPIVIGPGAGDNAGAALGLGASAGDVIISIGTSGTVFAVTETPVRDESGAVAGFADATGLYLPLVATLNAARVLDAIRTLLGVDHDELGELALSADPGSNGLSLRPYFEGERTPNRPDATASLFGMTLGSTTRPNLARAAIEGLLCGLADGLDALQVLGVESTRILLIGGAAQNRAVSTIASQVFDVPVVVPEPGEYVAAGAAVQAAWALTGSRPSWSVELTSAPEPDFRPVIREQYAAQPAG